MQSYSINHVESFHMFYLSHTRLEVMNINAQSCLKRLKFFFEKNEKQKMSVVLGMFLRDSPVESRKIDFIFNEPFPN
jgi:hypothetical protein